jgi:hypothetical protein
LDRGRIGNDLEGSDYLQLPEGAKQNQGMSQKAGIQTEIRTEHLPYANRKHDLITSLLKRKVKNKM